jgi:hypothetical protein
MSMKIRRYQHNNWCVDVSEEPWLIKAMTYALVGVWMMLMFATIQMYGPDPWVLGSGVIVLLAGMGWVLGQRVTYLRVLDWVELEADEPTSNTEEVDEWRRKNR